MNDTLKDARIELLAKGRKGTSCPCCGQFVKLYKRKFSTVMARGLISLYGLSGHGRNQYYYHVSEIMSKISPTGSNDFSKLRYYNLIEEEPNTKTSKKTSGNWRITHGGILFINGQLSVREYMLIYNTHLKGFEGGSVDILSVLGNKFNYKELMNGT